MSSGGNSLERAFRQAGEDAGAVFGAATDPEQLDLLRASDGRLPDNVFQLVREGKGHARRPGRPPGALNKRSQDLAKLVIQQHGDPVMAMASLYAMPLDQLVETCLIADGSLARQRRLDDMLGELTETVAALAKKAGKRGEDVAKNIDRLADACEALERAAQAGRVKPGDLAIKALNIKLAAAKAVAEYVHSKKPTEAVVRHQSDAVLVFPQTGGPAFDEKDADTRRAGELIAQALKAGEITSETLLGMRLVDNQLVDAEWTEADDGGEATP